MKNKKPKCDECDCIATSWSQELREIEPIRGKDGKLWANCGQIGNLQETSYSDVANIEPKTLN